MSRFYFHLIAVLFSCIAKNMNYAPTIIVLDSLVQIPALEC